MNATPGTGKLGPYRLDQLLGRGSVGEVYRAFHVDQDRVVALKLLREEAARSVEFQGRFRREAELAARLSEPHIVPIHGWGRIDHRLYLDMRYIDGPNLADRILQDGPLPHAIAVSIIEQIGSALDAAHRADVVHRDVKPSNILLSATPGETEVAYLTDFGIARAVQSSTMLTRKGTVVGTAAYMAPERYLERPLDRRVDVYSLGCVLYYCLTGEPPFPFGNLKDVVTAHLRTPPPVPSAQASVPQALDDVVARALAKDPQQRYSTAGALASAAKGTFGRSPSVALQRTLGAVAGSRSSRPTRGERLDEQTLPEPDR